ncbi:guanitoxin biosynthesis heme-dependent pre-guanitoxin N-hydroxylase GntA [Allobranchiibius sp. CTAmp26]|uniref:guanitoxin biosynthesis heme-dependent pre-guanitoxin N-hydroxylase GntA n=1 Tax=Allobranchiibius sp. CTAmp26 TaxID=2815214 RepID=UPI001AA1133F|nr:guanitoxin biosynthesis heme-dependent pre-guanitoxin N-hydroxylase GntA [Allobranchiibius sp. CTAmp26]MBO1756289.1 YqcI/YcgG family protein [Allobranchiibius sp. CTAmp26]
MPSRPPVRKLDTLLGSAAARDLENGPDGSVVRALTEMVTHPEYPCLGARSVFRRDTASIVVLDEMDHPDDLAALADHLRTFAAETEGSEDFVSLIAAFRSPATTTEARFEKLLWGVLQTLHDGDDQPWAHGVSQDPAQPHFAFSHAGTAFFIVGLHPGASRIARRAPLPMLVFNLHAQFERLRADGGFDRMRTAIRTRDTRLQGDVNPMAEDHGDSSEARQYSGRAVDDTWEPPFEARKDHS